MAQDRTSTDTRPVNSAPNPDPDADVNSPENTSGEAATAPATAPAVEPTNGNGKKAKAAASESASTERDNQKLVDEFLKRSGYKERDVLSANAERRTVVTANGGKYNVSRDGGIFVMSGPPTPKGHTYIAEAVDTGNLPANEL